MTEYKRIRYEVRDRVAEITMIREPVNAIDMLLAQEVVDAYGRVREDPEVRGVILTSDCKAAFSAGMDLKMIRGKTGLDLRNFLEVLYFGMHDAQYRLGKPSIAAVTAPARAAGVTLAVSCDMIVAADDIDLSYPEIDVGVIPAMHYVHLPRRLNRVVLGQIVQPPELIVRPKLTPVRSWRPVFPFLRHCDFSLMSNPGDVSRQRR